MFITDLITFNTTRIECTFPDGRTSSGTGFFVALCERDNSSIPVLVTNRHVVQNAILGKITLTLSKEHSYEPDIGNFKTINLENFSNPWIYHPTLDLAIMPVNHIIINGQKNGLNFYYSRILKDLIPTLDELFDIPSIQEIYLIGYPNGIWDSFNNQPIVRKGITATHPALHYNKTPTFVIDAACFNGSSGSPVFLIDLGKTTSREHGIQLGPSRIKLLGILYAGPQHTANGEIITTEIASKTFVRTNIPNHLGHVISSRALLDFEPILYYYQDHGQLPSRMTDCPCGSGKKYKSCCGSINT